MKILSPSLRFPKLSSLLLRERERERKRKQEREETRYTEKEKAKKEWGFLCHIFGKCCFLIREGPFLEMAGLHCQGLLKVLH